MILLRQHFIQQRNGVRLVLFNSDISFFQAELLHHKERSVDDILGIFQHQPVVGSNKRFALGAVYNQRIHFLQVLRIVLDMRRERRSAQTDQSAVSYSFYKVLSAVNLRRFYFLPDLLLFVCLNDNDRIFSAHHRPDTFNSRNRSWNAWVNRSTYKCIGITDRLSYFHVVPFFHKRAAGRANVLRHRNAYRIRDRHYLSLTRGSMFLMADLDTLQMPFLLTHFWNLPFQSFFSRIHELYYHTIYKNATVILENCCPNSFFVYNAKLFFLYISILNFKLYFSLFYTLINKSTDVSFFVQLRKT